MCLTTMLINAQNKDPVEDFKVKFNVYLNDKKVETDSVLVGFYNPSTTEYFMKITDDFVTYFKYNQTYNMMITHPNYNKVIIKIRIKSPNDLAYYNIYLNSNEPTKYINYD